MNDERGKVLIGREKKIIFCLTIILLCLTSIVGATFAVFTNQSENGTIGVNATSGNLDVDIVDTSGSSLVGEVLSFVTPTEKPIYFEPGATFYTQGFKVKNVGNIPINFRVYISADKDFDMASFEQAFDFYITTDPNNKDCDTDIKSFEDDLNVGESSETYYLVIKMHTDANDTFQDKTYSGIGITVYAVQSNVEIQE
ncbi:MAG: hypothetical protein IJW03_05095 [Clostridia bacterium]|nr:hypothetical protein [Clostridia bacterium]